MSLKGVTGIYPVHCGVLGNAVGSTGPGCKSYTDCVEFAKDRLVLKNVELTDKNIIAEMEKIMSQLEDYWRREREGLFGDYRKMRIEIQTLRKRLWLEH